MFARLATYLRSLEARLLLSLALTISAVLAIHAVLAFRSTQDHFKDFVHAEIERSSTLIRGATHDGMLLNRLADVQKTIERLVAAPEVKAIRVYNKDGVIALSGAPEELNHNLRLASDTCSNCHADDAGGDGKLLERSTITNDPDGARVLRQLTVIDNEPACAAVGCHASPEEQPLLGVLDVELSMAPLDVAVIEARVQTIWTTLVLVLISGLVAAVFVRRLVHRPVAELYRGTRRIAEGDLETFIDVPGQHELGRLAEAFNSMVGDLRSARHEATTASQRLEQKVAEKSEGLQRAQRQVLHMEKMSSLGQLSATVAHELNNPLSGMLTYARLVKRELLEQPLPPDVREELIRYLDLVDSECARCGAIVHNLLTFARSNGRDMVPTNVNDVIDRSLMLVRHHLEMADVRLERIPLEGDAVIVADANQLQQALVALLINAVEAMSGPDVSRRVLAVRARGGDEHVEIQVVDTGVGISAEHLPQIFEPFFSTKEASGVGLGLAVVYGIANRHGGTIEVSAEPGAGTTFRLRLRRRPEAAVEAA